MDSPDNIKPSETTSNETVTIDKKEHLAMLKILNFLPDEVLYWAKKHLIPALIVRRDYKSFQGMLVRVEFEPKFYEFIIEDSWTDYDANAKIKEVRSMRIPASMMVSYEEILDHQEKQIPKEQPIGANPTNGR